jgi:hypothetical protein
MRWREISEDLVEQTLSAPDWEEPSGSRRMNCWKRFGHRFLRVTHREEAERIVVISAVFKRRAPKGGRER